MLSLNSHVLSWRNLSLFAFYAQQRLILNARQLNICTFIAIFRLFLSQLQGAFHFECTLDSAGFKNREKVFLTLFNLIYRLVGGAEI